MLHEVDAATDAASLAGVPPPDLPDLAQQARIVLWRALQAGARFMHVDALRAWLREVGRRLAASYRRRRRRARTTACDPGELEDKGSWVPDAEQLTLGKAPEVLLDAALARLAATRPELHAIVKAHDLNGRSMAEVAADLGLRVNTAWNRLRMGRDLLRAWTHRAQTTRGGGI